MAVSSRVAERYAKSLLSLSEEQKSLEKVKEDMELYIKVYEENRDFAIMMQSPVINHSKKLAVLKKIFEGKIGKLAMSFLEIITRKNRERDLYGIALQVRVLYNRIKNIEVGHITTAIPLTPALRKEFTEMLSSEVGKTVKLEEKVNEELIGGYILRVEDRQIDQSIKGNLEKLKYKFSNNR